jgi:hypothetical protein
LSAGELTEDQVTAFLTDRRAQHPGFLVARQCGRWRVSA